MGQDLHDQEELCHLGAIVPGERVPVMVDPLSAATLKRSCAQDQGA